MKDLINKIHQGDCLEVMKTMADNSIDCVITDPPYGVLKDFDWDNVDYFQSSIKKWIAESLRVTKYGLLLFCAEKFLPLILKDEKTFQRLLIWNKKCGVGSINNGIWYSTEPIAVFIKNKEIEKRGDKDFSLSIFNKSKRDGNYQFDHPTIKPYQLMEWLIKHYTKEDDLILDPFAGSGSTCVAAQNLHRNFIGIELEEKYCEIARDRLRQDTLI